MRQSLRGMVLAAALAGAGLARGEMSFIVEVYDLQKTVTRQVMTSAEVKELKKTLAAEARVFAKAVELAKKDWDAAAKPAPGEKAVPYTPFPMGALQARRCQEKGSYTKPEDAQKRVEQMDTAEADAEAKKAKRNTGSAGKGKDTRDLERSAVISRAAIAVQEKIDELIQNPAGAAAKPAEAVGADGDAEKAGADKAGAKGAATKPAAAKPAAAAGGH
jgi:hypothetical protein